MTERRLYYDPTDDFQADVLVPAVKAREPFGDETAVIAVDPTTSTTRAPEDGVTDASDTPRYVFRDEPDGSITEAGGSDFIETHCVDGPTYDRLAWEADDSTEADR